MNRLFSLLILFGLLSACSNEFEQSDITKFQQKIENKTDIQSAEELIRLYYPHRIDENSEGNPTLTIDQKDLGNNKTEITLIHEGLLDDSQRSLKIVMTAQKNGDKWTVLEIKKSRKCYKGRGHTNWGAEWCS